MGRDGAEEERVSVRLGPGDGGGADIAAGAGPVLDHHALAEDLAHLLADEPGDDIGRATCGEGDDQVDRAAGEIGLRARLRAGEAGGAGCDEERAAVEKAAFGHERISMERGNSRRTRQRITRLALINHLKQ